jgi:hypothetical protein
LTPTRRTLLALALALACTVGGPATPAIAQSGVTVDPGSPSGKEYAIPLTSARRDAAAGGKTSTTPKSGSKASSPLFGEGVGDPAGSSSGSKPRGNGPSKGQRKSRTRSTPRAPGSNVVDRAVRPVAASVPNGGSGSTLTIAAVALSVLLLGGVIGSIARRRES